jgi:TrmH family RNA methyltransferase
VSNAKPIRSSDNPLFKAALQLLSNRGRQKQDRISIFGVREVHCAVASGTPIEEVFICRAYLSSEQWMLAEKLFTNDSVPIWDLPAELFDKLVYGERLDGLLAIAKRPSVDLDKLRLPPQSLVIVLESVEKPGNIGAVARSADAVGANALILAEPISDLFHPNCIRASMGCVFSLRTAVGRSAEIRQWLEQQEIAIVAARTDALQFYTAVDFRSATALVMGNEARGLSEFWRGRGINEVRLPMRGLADSLNVSVTAAVLMFEAARQRSLEL